MTDMNVLFVASVVHEKLLIEILKTQPRYYGIQGQYFMRLMLLGLKANGVKVNVLSNNLAYRYWHSKRGERHCVLEEGIGYNYFFRKQRGGYLHLLLRIIRFIKLWKNKLEKDNSAILCDGLNFTLLLSCFLCKIFFNIRVTVFVTDMPRYLSMGFLSRIKSSLQEYIIRQMDAFVTLTNYMDADLNPNHKPSVVIEGMVDVRAKCESNKGRRREKVCMYSGSIHKVYGIKKLLDSFLAMNNTDYILEIYGDGDYRAELVELAAKHDRIIYKGLVSRDVIVARQKQVALLINPRPSWYEYTQYSFPSKIMEYMLSGTPVLTTKLPGIPAEYDKYLYYFEDESIEAMANKMSEVLSMDYTECLRKASEAQSYVMNEKNNFLQMKKLLSIL